MELHFKELVKDLNTLLNPKTTDRFFRKVRIKPVNEMLVYLSIFGLFTFIGYFLRHTFFYDPKHPFIAIWIALPYSLIGNVIPTGVLSIYIMSYILHFFGEKIVARKVSHEEAMMVISYSAIPQLFGGFFGIIDETWVLYLLSIIYSVALLYIGIKSTFGFKFSVRCFVFTLVFGFICSLILSKIIFTLLIVILKIPSEYYGLR